MLSKPFASKLLISLLVITSASTNASESLSDSEKPLSQASEPLSPIKPATATSQKEKICAIYPHLKDSYWLSVNYGMVSEAEKQQVEFRVLEAGGYPNVAKQASQLVLCTKWGADAIILGTVSPDAYHDNLTDWVGSTPVFATVNELTVSEEQQKVLKGTVGVDWYQMGFQVGEYLAKLHPKGSGKTPIALLLGPQSSGGTKPVALGFYDAIKSSDVTIAISYWADNDKELQRNLVQQVIEQPDIKYIVGSAVAIEAAISEPALRWASIFSQRGLTLLIMRSMSGLPASRRLASSRVLCAPAMSPPCICSSALRQ